MRVPFQAEFAPTKPRPKEKARGGGDDQKRNSLLPVHVRKIVQPRRFAINISPKTRLGVGVPKRGFQRFQRPRLSRLPFETFLGFPSEIRSGCE